MRFSSKVVTSVIALNVLFTVACLFICYHTEQSIDSLVVAFFAFTTGELWALASIKKAEAKKGEYEE